MAPLSGVGASVKRGAIQFLRAVIGCISTTDIVRLSERENLIPEERYRLKGDAVATVVTLYVSAVLLDHNTNWQFISSRTPLKNLSRPFRTDERLEDCPWSSLNVHDCWIERVETPNRMGKLLP